MERAAKNDFTKGPMWRVILQMGIPMMLAQLVNVLYSVVDRMYIGHMAGVGPLALTGLGLTMPIVSVIGAFAGLCGTGGGPLCSIARGEGKLVHAEKVMGNALTMLLLFGVLLTLALELWLEPVLYLLGASAETYGFAAPYARIYIAGTLFVMLSLGMNYFINAQGFAKTGMLTVAIGAVLNIALDPIFIFALGLGIRGAAIATVISQGCSAAWAMRFLLSDKAILDLKLKNMVPEAAVIGRILALGTTGFVMQVTNGIVQSAYNIQLQAFGGDLYVGAMTVINSIREVFFMIVHGLTSGSQPVMGYNYGARAYGRVREGIRFVTLACAGYAALVFCILMGLPEPMARVFNNDPALLRICVPAIRVYFCGFVVMSLQMAGQCIFVGLGKSRQAVFFSLLRKVFVVVPLIFLLPRIPTLGVMGVFWSEPISDLIGGAACYLTMYFTVYRTLGEKEELR